MTLAIWLALRNAINSRIAIFSALNRSYSPANEKETPKQQQQQQPVKFGGLFKVTNKIAGIWNAKKPIVWRILELWFPKLCFNNNKKKTKTKNKTKQNKKTCDLIVGFLNRCNNVVIVECIFRLKLYLWYQIKLALRARSALVFFFRRNCIPFSSVPFLLS